MSHCLRDHEDIHLPVLREFSASLRSYPGCSLSPFAMTFIYRNLTRLEAVSANSLLLGSVILVLNKAICRSSHIVRLVRQSLLNLSAPWSYGLPLKQKTAMLLLHKRTCTSIYALLFHLQQHLLIGIFLSNCHVLGDREDTPTDDHTSLPT